MLAMLVASTNSTAFKFDDINNNNNNVNNNNVNAEDTRRKQPKRHAKK